MNKNLIVIVCLAAFVWLLWPSGSDGKPPPNAEKKTPEFGDREALVLCQFAFEKISRDPDKAEIPAVKNFGKGDEAYFAWGPSTKVMRMRNGLGLDVATTGSCIVSKSAKKITSMTLDGKTII